MTLHFTFWASPQHILLHFPIHLLHFPIKFASFPQKNASFPQQFAAFPQQNASFPQQFAAFPYAMLCHIAKKYFTKYSQFFSSLRLNSFLNVSNEHHTSQHPPPPMVPWGYKGYKNIAEEYSQPPHTHTTTMHHIWQEEPAIQAFYCFKLAIARITLWT